MLIPTGIQGGLVRCCGTHSRSTSQRRAHGQGQAGPRARTIPGAQPIGVPRPDTAVRATFRLQHVQGHEGGFREVRTGQGEEGQQPAVSFIFVSKKSCFRRESCPARCSSSHFPPCPGPQLRSSPCLQARPHLSPFLFPGIGWCPPQRPQQAH